MSPNDALKDIALRIELYDCVDSVAIKAGVAKNVILRIKKGQGEMLSLNIINKVYDALEQLENEG